MRGQLLALPESYCVDVMLAMPGPGHPYWMSGIGYTPLLLAGQLSDCVEDFETACQADKLTVCCMRSASRKARDGRPCLGAAAAPTAARAAMAAAISQYDVFISHVGVHFERRAFDSACTAPKVPSRPRDECALCDAQVRSSLLPRSWPRGWAAILAQLSSASEPLSTGTH